MKSRDNEILKLLEESPSQFVSVESLADYFKTSESTIRRDLQKMAGEHQLMRVHGGAASLDFSGNFKFERLDRDYLERERTEPDVKKMIARYAAKFIKEGSCIYLDASTTVAAMIPFFPDFKNTTYITNSSFLATKIAERGLTCYVTGGELKLTTNAFIGPYAIDFISKFNFDIGFFGTNGIHPQAKFTTPDPQECAIKETAIAKCYQVYILADNTKFDNISTATFSDFNRPTLITDKANPKYSSLIRIVEVAPTEEDMK
ncbi:MAG: DeoR/GlpR family DNA-binding transcription regulator [Bacilli bacterium]|nr:DeoR/GlpR family DNA-binding transcription regulator [Bacilli bacterium]